MYIELSVVIPVFNEEESIAELYSQIEEALPKFVKSYEVVFIDDGSTDNSLNLLKDLEKKHKEVRVYSFRKNLGKSSSLTLGFEMARGEYIATLDADLQDDPQSIKTLYDVLIKQDYDFLTGWRKNRQDSPKKVLSSKLFNNLVIPFLFGIKIHDHNGGLKLYRSSVAKELQLYGGMHRFIAILVNEMGYKTGEHEVIHHPRKYGHSKYKFTKIISDIPDLFTIYFLTKYTRRPLHFFGKIGAVLFLIGSMVLIYLSVIHFMGASIGRRPLLFFGILMVLAGLQTIFTGLIADLVVNMNTQNQVIKFPTRYESSK